jgi:hypothetical protein
MHGNARWHWMIYMLMANGDKSEFPEAASAVIENDQLVLRCPKGSLIHTIEARLVTAYGSQAVHFKDFSTPPVTSN